MKPVNINQRIAYLNDYLTSIDRRVDAKQNQIDNKIKTVSEKVEKKDSFSAGFQNILETVSSKLTNKNISKSSIVKEQQSIQKKDNFGLLPKGFEQFIDDVSNAERISPNLVKSLIHQESGGNPNAKSKAGALGLTQLMPQTAKDMKVFNPMNPYQNVKGGVKYLSQMLNKFNGNIQHALAAYNAGPQAVEKYNGIPPYPETQNYVKSIMADYLNREGYRPVDVQG